MKFSFTSKKNMIIFAKYIATLINTDAWQTVAYQQELRRFIIVKYDVSSIDSLVVSNADLYLNCNKFCVF